MQEEVEDIDNVSLNRIRGGEQTFGRRVPTASATNDKSVSLRVNNYAAVPQDVQLFNGLGSNSITNFNNDYFRRSQDLDTSDWGGNFLDVEGNVWVNDGKTLPFAFNAVVQLQILYSFGAGTIVSLSTQVGEPIDTFLLRYTEAVRVATGTAGYSMFNMSTLGSRIHYGSTGCNVDLIQYNIFLGDAPQYVVITGFFPNPAQTPMVVTRVFSFQLRNPLPTDWIVVIEIFDLSSPDPSNPSGDSSYRDFVNSLLNQDLRVETLRKYSNNSDQVNEVIEWESYDVDGTIQNLAQTEVIDPYQAQPVTIDSNYNVVIDGQVFATITMLAGEYLELTFDYVSAGVTNYEEVKKLDDILIEQGTILRDKNTEMALQEQKETEKAFLNFSATIDDKNNYKQGTLIALLAGFFLLNK